MDMSRYHETLNDLNTVTAVGKVTKVAGLVTEALGPGIRVGGICDIHQRSSSESAESQRDLALRVKAEVVGFRENRVLLMPLEEIRGIAPGVLVTAREKSATVGVGQDLLGRVIDGLGNPIDGKGPIRAESRYPIYAKPVNPLSRQRISRPLDVGIRAINGLLTMGCGQRMGIFSGSGIGKSILLGMIARKSEADVNVIALIGERGRELNDFIERDLGEEGLKRSVIVVATSDHLPLVRMRGAFVAMAIAEFFRDLGKHVIFMMDSVTRFAMAQREIGLAAGEPPTTKGYTPSVFTLLPKLLERAGTTEHAGTITGLYTVLVEGDDMNEPIADAVRGILDGHTVLSRDLAIRGHYPAIDVLSSISRLMYDITGKRHRKHAEKMKETLAVYNKAEDLINIGAYAPGSNPRIDYAVSMNDKINAYLRQDVEEYTGFRESVAKLGELFGG